MTTTIQVLLPAQHAAALHRSQTRRYRLGVRLHPEAITEAWYAADCPRAFDARAAGIKRSTRARWAVACWLRGAKRLPEEAAA